MHDANGCKLQIVNFILKNSFCGDETDDVISYVSAIANMEGGYLVIGVHDKTLEND